MDPDLRTRAESRLADAAAALDLSDPRPPYRERLRALREVQPAAFDDAIAHYESHVLPALCSDDPLAVWLEYGRFLVELAAPAHLSIIDGSGRALDAAAGIPGGCLAILLPQDTSEPPLVVTQPIEPTPAQQATLDLLVHRRLTLQ